MESLGRKLKYKGEPDSTARTVLGADNDWVELSDNQRIPANRVSELFEEVQVDPDAIINNSSSVMNLLQESIKNGIIQPNKSSKRNVVTRDEDDDDDSWMHEHRSEPVVLADTGNAPAQNYAPAPAQRRSQEEELLRKYANQQTPSAAEAAARNAEYMRQNGMEPEDEDLKHVAPEYQQSVRQLPTVSAPSTAPTAAAMGAYQPVATNSAFGKLKKSHPVQINIVLEEKIPDVEAIRYINNLFEDSIIDQLASEFTQKLLADPYLLEDLIKENLEALVYPDRKKKKPARARKPAAKKTDNK